MNQLYHYYWYTESISGVDCGNAARNRQTDTQTAVTNIHFASATSDAKSNQTTKRLRTINSVE